MSYPGWRWDGTQWQRVPQQKRRNTGLIVTLGIVIPVVAVVLCIGGVVALMGSGEDEPQAGNDQAVEEETDTEPSTQGRDGQFEFTVQDVERGAAPADQFSDPAQGEWVLVTLDVENIGDESRNFSSTNQKLYDTQGREYEAASGTGEWDYQQVNPGNSTEARLYFDVPEGEELDHLRLHDDLFSNGVEVGLPE